MARRPNAAPRNRRAVVANRRNDRLTDTGLGPRRAALNILLDVRRGTPFDVALERRLGGLSEADRRLAHQLAAGVLRHGDALDALLAPAIRRGLAGTDPEILEVLRLGSYQLHHLDRVPDHAAVATAVDLTRERCGERQAGFVNAVLRRISQQSIATPPDQPNDLDLAAATSHPSWLVDRWLKRFGQGATRALLEWNNSHPPLVIQPTDGDLDALLARFALAGVRSFPAPFGAGLVLEETRPDRLPGFVDGSWYVQDPAQAMVVAFAAFPAGGTVYDACAAPGGKALGLAVGSALVLAGDIARGRVSRLGDNIRRTGATNVRILRADALHPPIRLVDAVLLDAPCLGTGTFARHPDARLRVRMDALERLVRQQERLLDAAAEVVRPGGVLCYATCSLEPEENGVQIDRFLARRPDFHRQPPGKRALPMTAAGDLEILPQRDGMDGAFAARLVRRAVS